MNETDKILDIMLQWEIPYNEAEKIKDGTMEFAKYYIENSNERFINILFNSTTNFESILTYWRSLKADNNSIYKLYEIFNGNKKVIDIIWRKNNKHNKEL